MDDEKRRKRVLWLIGKLSDDYPDLRVCQIIGNALGPGDHYHKSDQVFQDGLVRLMDEYSRNKPYQKGGR